LTSLAWKDFYRKYPESGGWIELSAVGFNPEKTVAVVYVGHHCGNLCAGGHFQVLLKKNGKWAPIEWKGIASAWASGFRFFDRTGNAFQARFTHNTELLTFPDPLSIYEAVDDRNELRGLDGLCQVRLKTGRQRSQTVLDPCVSRQR